MSISLGGRKIKLNLGSRKVKKIYKGSDVVYSGSMQIFPNGVRLTKSSGVTVSDTEIYINSRSAYCRTTDMVDVTSYSKLVAVVSETGASTAWDKRIGISTNVAPNSRSRYAKSMFVGTVGTHELDISDMSGEYYIACSVSTSQSDNSKLRITLFFIE